jgi:hypothetical protein
MMPFSASSLPSLLLVLVGMGHGAILLLFVVGVGAGEKSITGDATPSFGPAYIGNW